jgi:hypothetical protein
MDKYDEAEKENLVVSFCNFVKVPKIGSSEKQVRSMWTGFFCLQTDKWQVVLNTVIKLLVP